MKQQDIDYTADPAEWKGYDIDQLRYRRAYLLARCEIEKIKLTTQAASFKEGIPTFKSSGIASRMLKGLNYMDYAYLAYKIVSKVMRLTGRKRRR